MDERSRTYTWSDPLATAAAGRELHGLDFIKAIMAGEIPAPPISATLDFTIAEVEAGRVVVTSRAQEWQYNPIGSVHGGIYATLLDTACGIALQSLLPAGTPWTSLDLTVKFLRGMNPASGEVRTTGTVTHHGRRTALAEAKMVDEKDRLLATATSSLLILSD